MGPTILYFGIALGLVVMNGFFVAAEFALVRVRTSRLKELAAEGNSGATRALAHLDKLDEALAIAQLGITMASLGIGWVGEPAFAGLLEPLFAKMGVASEPLRHGISFAIGFSAISAMHIVVGEQVPKMFAIARAEETSIAVSRPMSMFRFVLYLPMIVLKWSTDVILDLMGLPLGAEHESAPSEQELRQLFAASHAHGHLSETEREILSNVFEFADRTVREVMVPRVEVAWIDVNEPFEEGLQFMASKPFTRYPLAEGDLDKVIGLVHTRDLFIARQRGREITNFGQVQRKVLYLPESNTLQEALAAFQRGHQSLAVVFDEFGSVAGILSLEDVIEEIVGDIEDEFDPSEAVIVDLGDGMWLIDGDVPLHDVDETLSSSFSEQSEGEYVTVGGLVIDELGRVPIVGDEVEVGRFLARVMEVDRLRILKVRMQLNQDRGESNRDLAKETHSLTDGEE